MNETCHTTSELKNTVGKEPALAAQLTSLRNEVSQVKEVVGELKTRLRPVMLVCPESGAKDIAEPSVLPEAIAQIADQAKEIRELKRTLHEILENLEV